MQASKIVPGLVYAVRRGEALLRFRVIEVNTITKRRSANRSPHDSTSEIVGHWLDGDTPRKGELPPDDILGKYEDYAELVERKRQEEAATEAKRTADAKQAKADRLALYAFLGIEPPQKADDYSQIFRVSFGRVEINSEGARAIVARIAALKK
jgi:hypothetical protein